MQQVHIIGLGLDHSNLPQNIRNRIAMADILVGGKRLLEVFQDHPGTKVPIKSPLATVIKDVEKQLRSGKEVVVLADGDPGFFGIGKQLIKSLGAEQVLIYPNVTTLQGATSRLKVSWENIKTLSLHGRKDIRPLLRALVSEQMVGVYTDQTLHPGRIAEELILRSVDTFRMHVFENLFRDEEQMGCFELLDATKRAFSPLNFVLLERIKRPQIPLHLGLDDDFYLHEKGLVTKREIRAVGLALLEIRPCHTLWDLGAGCGSVAIEASVLAHEGTVLAVEKNASRIQLIRENIRRTGAYGVEPIHGEMPECLKSLPEPDRIFLGGGVGRDTGALEEALRRLKPGGRIVLHLVLIGSLERARNVLADMNWPFTIGQVQVSRSRCLAGDQRLEALNPVWVLSATKPH
jgi:precorrin-6Y C5,15-methyltransferase (decarboxylating)